MAMVSILLGWNRSISVAFLFRAGQDDIKNQKNFNHFFRELLAENVKEQVEIFANQSSRNQSAGNSALDVRDKRCNKMHSRLPLLI